MHQECVTHKSRGQNKQEMYRKIINGHAKTSILSNTCKFAYVLPAIPKCTSLAQFSLVMSSWNLKRAI